MARKFSGRKLKTAREAASLTRAQLAARITDVSGIACSESTVAAWENDINDPGIDSAFAACTVLGVKLDTLTAAETEPAKAR